MSFYLWEIDDLKMSSPARTLLLLSCLLSPCIVSKSVSEACAGTQCYAGETGDPRPRSSRPPRQHSPATHSGTAPVPPKYQRAPSNPPPAHGSESHATLRSQHGRSGERAGDAVRTHAAEVFGPGCAGAHCVTTKRAAQPANDTRECRGLECRLPLRIRPQPRARPCLADACGSGPEEQPTLVHVPDRAAQFLAEFPDIGYPSSELGAAPLGVQLTCDIKPGENEVPSEDALVLHLQLAKGQEKLVEALRAQQLVIRELQQQLVDQQGALLSQQRQILDQQRRMYEQMDAVKAQYGLLSETVKQVSFQSLQGELQSYFESHLAGLQSQARSHLQKSYTVHKTDVDAKVADVAGDAELPLLACHSACGPEEYCDFQRRPPRCERCTMCPPGFFLVSQCSPNADRMCQDRDECLEIQNLCGERVKCLNTPGGFRCLGVSERELSAGLCGHEYFYNQELQECQACSDCDGGPMATPCTATSDAECGAPSENTLSRSWSGSVALPPAGARNGGVFPGVQLSARGPEAAELLAGRDGSLGLRQHGLLWMDHNFALKHSCRNFLQVGVRLNGSEEEGRDLSGVRVEQPERKHVQGVSVSAVAEVEPNQTLSLVLRSSNQHCNQSRDLQLYELGPSAFSLLWLSHDTGAVAMTAHTSTAAHYQSNYRPAFRITAVSDPYMVALTHDSRGVRFTERGVAKFVLQQALYAMGHTCVRDGFALVAYVNANGTNQEVARSFKTGVNYRDTSVTLSAAAAVDAGDWLNFEVLTPSQCNIRYFGDSSGISLLSLLWIPAGVSSSLAASVSRTGLPSGAVRNRALLFQQVGPDSAHIRLAGAGEPHARRNFVFREAGTANVALEVKLIHSCSVVKLILHRHGQQGAPSALLAQQVGGHMPEGSEWASVGVRSSFEVQNGTAVYVTLDCVRGRINQITHEGSTGISVLWVAA
ncbi:uncharacterized protein si:ch211-37e10.2 isoform X2 [Electrophorus electricus]|uniref:uncharacterized protein si:ch211-37e10.2 isoform X2 n=1 Tax=Electrophorus electricus TaxID=8005 RepID=UPI0015CFC3C0|nr:uncharacterized protein si:ch211-37e10.2 isoform X2 [Electrophorus electricus]